MPDRIFLHEIFDCGRLRKERVLTFKNINTPYQILDSTIASESTMVMGMNRQNNGGQNTQCGYKLAPTLTEHVAQSPICHDAFLNQFKRVLTREKVIRGNLLFALRLYHGADLDYLSSVYNPQTETLSEIEKLWTIEALPDILACKHSVAIQSKRLYRMENINTEFPQGQYVDNALKRLSFCVKCKADTYLKQNPEFFQKSAFKDNCKKWTDGIWEHYHNVVWYNPLFPNENQRKNRVYPPKAEHLLEVAQVFEISLNAIADGCADQFDVGKMTDDKLYYWGMLLAAKSHL